MPISNDDLNVVLQNVSALISDFTTKLNAWASGVAGGGPNSDGKYPLPTSLGSYILTPCPAQTASDAQKLVLAGPGTGIQMGVTAGFTGTGNTYTFKLSDNGKIFNIGGSTSTSTVTMLLPDNAPAGWAVAIIQLSDGKITVRKANDPTGTNSNLRNRQNFFSTAGKGSMMTVVCDQTNSSTTNSFYTVAGDVQA